MESISKKRVLLANVNIVGQKGPKHIYIEGASIGRVADATGVLSPADTDRSIFFDNAIAFPGLINSHDHLDFNLFHQLKNNDYKSYRQWGEDIHKGNHAGIQQVLNIPKQLRTQWGIYKNLLNGITTVVNHGAKQPITNDLIDVYQRVDSFHSISGEKNWRLKLMNPFRKNYPVAIHIGEGTDAAAAKEIDELLAWNILHRPLTGIHGIAMNAQQAADFAALVWCPDSNCFLYGKTAAIDQLKEKTKIVFGTDATLTANWNLWEHLRLARILHMLDDAALWDTVTTTPANLWGFQDSGRIEKGFRADMVVARSAADNWNALYALNPEDILLILHKGNVRLFDQSVYDQLAKASFSMDDFYKIQVGANVKYIQGNLPALMDEIRQYHPNVHFPIAAK